MYNCTEVGHEMKVGHFLVRGAAVAEKPRQQGGDKQSNSHVDRHPSEFTVKITEARHGGPVLNNVIMMASVAPV